ncbi:MAG: bifunctional histidinol-phosphatase/imidazoleglycerol-phosphate dehydratase HisB [Flavobacteriales bacterium]|nr:bifunctional histidinol-phosphatase/imidazoleglycerol-phosphate dehydratase HisB [Flavobacteriales bacterium]
MKRVLFIDRDGTLVKEPADEQVDNINKIDFLPGVFTYLSKIARELDYELVMVTNQDGLGTPSFPREDFQPVHDLIVRSLESEGIKFNKILIDESFPEDGLETRKPGLGLLQPYIYGDYDLTNSVVIGDRLSDVQLAKNLGSKSIFIGDSQEEADYCVSSWNEIHRILGDGLRKVEFNRNTSETNIALSVDLDGSGKSEISTGLNFFDHMLDQIARHGGIDLKLKVDGDLEVDEHHTIEDVGLALGQAIGQALGSKKSIGRYGFYLPMDESSATVALDLGGRPYFEFNCDFEREYVGDMPTEMVGHFFKSLSTELKSNLHITVKGENTHHKVEAAFKGFARSLRMAKEQNNSGVLPSTKGSL